MKIHVHTQADKTTCPFVVYMWDAMLTLASKPSELKLTCHCLATEAQRILANLPQATTKLVGGYNAERAGSGGHGACIEDALKMTNDESVHIIVDSDTVVLAKGWDNGVLDVLFKRQIGIFGATYEDIGGFSSGTGNVQTYKNVPNVVWVALSPNFDWTHLEAMPKKEATLQIDTDELALVYNLPKGYKVLRDVAWQVPEYIAARSIPYFGMKQLKPTSNAIVTRGLSDYHEEFHLDNVPFVAHQRGSARHTYRGDDISRSFYDIMDKHLSAEKLQQQRWT